MDATPLSSTQMTVGNSDEIDGQKDEQTDEKSNDTQRTVCCINDVITAKSQHSRDRQ